MIAASDWHPLLDVVTGATPDLATRFRVQLEPAALVVEVEAQCDVLRSPFDERNDPLYEADALELFLDPLGGGHIYRELEASPTGAMFDAWIVNRTDLERPEAKRELHTVFPRAQRNSPSVQVRIDGRAPDSPDRKALRTGLRATSWAARWTIPLATAQLASGGVDSEDRAGALPVVTPPDDWRLNVFRIQHRGSGADPILQAWRPTGRRDFHRPEVFGPVPWR